MRAAGGRHRGGLLPVQRVFCVLWFFRRKDQSVVTSDPVSLFCIWHSLVKGGVGKPSVIQSPSPPPHLVPSACTLRPSLTETGWTVVMVCPDVLWCWCTEHSVESALRCGENTLIVFFCFTRGTSIFFFSFFAARVEKNKHDFLKKFTLL